MEYQEMAKYYDLFYKKKNYDKESTFLENLINKRKTILDVGCGTGLHMHYLEEKNYQVEGLDLNEGIISSPDSKVAVYVEPTNEELMIALDTYDLIK